MHRWMHRAAGGTIQRLNPGLATEWLRSRIEKKPTGCAPHRFLPLISRIHCDLAMARRHFPLGNFADRFERPQAKALHAPSSAAAFTFLSCRAVIDDGKRAKEISCPPHSTLDSGQPPKRR